MIGQGSVSTYVWSCICSHFCPLVWKSYLWLVQDNCTAVMSCTSQSWLRDSMHGYWLCIAWRCHYNNQKEILNSHGVNEGLRSQFVNLLWTLVTCTRYPLTFMQGIISKSDRLIHHASPTCIEDSLSWQYEAHTCSVKSGYCQYAIIMFQGSWIIICKQTSTKSVGGEAFPQFY